VNEEDVHLLPSDSEWGISMLLANNSTINWGPWCDLQRDLIWRFFNPVDHKEWTPPIEPSLTKFKFDLGKLKQICSWQNFISFNAKNYNFSLETDIV
jgi:hypothetical protein